MTGWRGAEGDAVATRLRVERLLAIVRGADPQATSRTIDVIAASGIGLIEVSLTSTDALAVIRAASQRLAGSALIGAGTIVGHRDAAAAAAAGAAFLVTPAAVLDPRDAPAPSLPLIVGALTPTEVAQAMALAPVAIKLFPASLGGPPYLAALRQPFPDVPFVPVGGVDASTAGAYLAAGAIAVGVGSPLVGDAASGGDLDELARRARSFRAATEEAAWSRS